jgi:hypothetical protein
MTCVEGNDAVGLNEIIQENELGVPGIECIPPVTSLQPFRISVVIVRRPIAEWLSKDFFRYSGDITV